MKFRTEYEPSSGPFVLDPSLPVVMAGSCFAQNIAAKMNECNWKAINPFGTLYNPLSIFFALDIMTDNESGALRRFESSLFQFNGLWHSNLLDSSFSSRIGDDCIREFTIRRQLLLDSLAEGLTLIITFGSSIVYYLKETRKGVGNCHKRPSDLFYTERMSVSDMSAYALATLQTLRERFPGVRVIFTVSPVRYLKYGFEGNSRMKAVLLLGVEDILKYSEDTDYFPAYEIINDDLRDYRFYAADLVHPSPEAVNYVWERFVERYVDAGGKELLRAGEKSFKRGAHRPLTGALGKPLA